LLIDIAAFYWLQAISQLITSQILKSSIYIVFWVFTIGLIASIIVLKFRLDTVDPRRKQLVISSLYGISILSFVPKLIFVIIISLLYFANYLFSKEASLLIVPLIGVFSGFLPFFAILYGIFRTLYRFKVHPIEIKFEELPNSLIGLKIVQISDLHLGSFNFRYHILNRAIKLINELEPDFIFFTGDLVNNYAWELRGWDSVLKQLSAKKGKYAVLGNHDYGDYSQWNTKNDKHENFKEIKQFYKKIDFKLLLNEADIIDVNGEKLAIVGVENWGKPPFKHYGNLTRALTDVVEIPFKILLSHDPSHWENEVVQQTDIALTLSGHTHGMQAAISLKNKEWSPIKYKYKHWAGLYKQQQQYLYVNRGLGWLGFPGRLGVRPEITFIEFE
jgi:predicted MPP superfamily phosphohydrolase